MIIGMFIFPDMTQLDFTGPHEVFIKLPGTEVKIVAPSAAPVVAPLDRLTVAFFSVVNHYVAL